MTPPTPTPPVTYPAPVQNPLPPPTVEGTKVTKDVGGNK